MTPIENVAQERVHVLTPAVRRVFSFSHRSTAYNAFSFAVCQVQVKSIQFSYYINNRQPNGSLSNVLSRLAVGVRVVQSSEMVPLRW